MANEQLSSASLILVGFGALLDVVSWIMALVASALMGSWGWFVALLILGLLGLLLLVMVVYSAAGPGHRRQKGQGRLVVT
jgi:hypothetical protein